MQGQDELGRNWFPGSRKAPTPLGAIERGIAPGNLCHEEGKKNQNEKEKIQKCMLLLMCIKSFTVKAVLRAFSSFY